MNAERWKHVERLYHAARGLTGSAREQFLIDASCGDADLLRELESLLQHAQQSSSGILNEPFTLDAATVSSSAPALTGREIEGYTVRERIGAGGMGEVYRAHDRRLQRDVALKVLPASVLGGGDDQRRAERLRRFSQEAQALGALNHPHIVTVHEVGIVDGAPFIAMELVEGLSLRERIQSGPLALAESLEITTQVARALASAHEKGIVHRDIKPDNVMIRPDGYVKVLDFGVAMLRSADAETSALTNAAGFRTRGTSVVGTPAYMSPEQVAGAAVDARTDIFSLGVLLCEALTGSNPFAGSADLDVVSAVNATPEPAARATADLPAGVRDIILKALQRDPRQRFRTAAELAVALQGQLATRRPIRRRAIVAAVAALVIVVAVVARLIPKRSALPVSQEARIVESANFESPSRAQVRESIKRYEEAIRINPTYAPAWAGLGTAQIALTYFGDVPGRDTLSEAKRAAQEALRLDSSQSSAWRTLGWVSHYLEWDHPTAEREFLRAIELDPQEPRALEWYTGLLMDLGRFDEALMYSRRAQNAAPRWLMPVATNGYIHYLNGHLDLAIAQYQRALEWDPNFGVAVQQLARVYMAQGRYDLAIEQLKRSNQLMGDVPFAAADLGYALGVAGHRSEAQKMLSDLVARRERGYYPAFALGEIELGLGHTEAALQWLERACDEGNVGWNLPSSDPFYNQVRTNPRFLRLLQRMHLQMPPSATIALPARKARP
jgi:serine/threonine protein kinase/Tfp pilus assembly protein PilF